MRTFQLRNQADEQVLWNQVVKFKYKRNTVCNIKPIKWKKQ